ncbi:MAG: DNA polymerase [Desulfomonilaceae bacterium]
MNTVTPVSSAQSPNLAVTGIPFKEIWLYDFEFGQEEGERPRPICLVAHEMNSSKRLRIWESELLGLSRPPFDLGKENLFVAYFASAELGCHLALEWPLPKDVLDLYAEFRCLVNGYPTPYGRGLLGALAWFGLDHIDATEKDSMRQLALRGGPWSEEEKRSLLDYCESDVFALEKLLGRMARLIDWPRALLRGRYVSAAAAIEHAGIPVDVKALHELKSHWGDIQETLIGRIDKSFGVYEGTSFKYDLFQKYLTANRIPWPRLETGRLDLSNQVFKDMSLSCPQILPLRELRVSLSQMKLNALAVGRDGRNRSMISPFGARTGRNTPSNTRFIFGPATWLRGLIKPSEGSGIAYIDWSQQELGIAAALSGDSVMQAAYLSGDPYMAFAIQAGAAPAGATKESHKSVRNLFKSCSLAVQYGMGAKSLALKIDRSESEARELLRLHRETYRDFWKWSDAVVNYAMIHGKLWTTFGWRIDVRGNESKESSIRNWPMQGNGAEMLRLACIHASDNGVTIVAPVHDAILIEFPLDQAADYISAAEGAMAHASRIVLNGFELKTDVQEFRHPERFVDERGRAMWDCVWEIINTQR